MAIRAKKNRLFRVSEEAAIGNGIILEKGDRILVLREDEIPTIAADETRDPENDVGYDIVDGAADDFSNPTQESRRRAFRKKMEMARRRREAMRRKKMREEIIIDEEDETSEEPMSEEDEVEADVVTEEGEVETDKVEERYQRILRRREAARRAMKRGVRRSEARKPVARKPLSIVERKARLARAKREMMLRRRARIGR